MKLVIASLLCAAASIAHADPTSYVQSGVTVGGDHDLYGAITISGGYHLGGTLWAHGLLADGGTAGVDEVTYTSAYTAARAGVETRNCTAGGAVCGIAGVDRGIRHESLMAEYDHNSFTNALVVGRVAGDLGSTHLRFRPGLELSVDDSGRKGLGLGLDLAYLF